VSAISAQEGKNWTEWSKKDAEKMLNDSGWAQTQTERQAEQADTTVITATQSGRNQADRKGESPETLGQRSPMHIRVRLLTAKPIREAFSRLVIASQPSSNKELEGQLQGFIDRDFGNYLVVAIVVDSDDKKMAAASMAGLTKLTAELLKDKVYIERKDGKKLALVDYKAPIADNLGAKLIFERTSDGQPFLTEDAESVKFVAELSPKMKVNVKFKVASMAYKGRLEY
jgi:hypothetical protein